MRKFFTKTEQKMWQRIGCGLTIVSADFYARTIRGGGYVRAAGEKIVHFNLDQITDLSGLIWTSMIHPGPTNHRRQVLNLD